MVKSSTNYAVLIYGLLILGLGYLGYAQGASRISGIMGLSLGGLLVICASLMFAGKKAAAYVAVLLTLILTATFGIRYSITHKQLPAIMAVCSAGMLIFLLAKTAKWNR